MLCEKRIAHLRFHTRWSSSGPSQSLPGDGWNFILITRFALIVVLILACGCTSKPRELTQDEARMLLIGSWKIESDSKKAAITYLPDGTFSLFVQTPSGESTTTKSMFFSGNWECQGMTIKYTFKKASQENEVFSGMVGVDTILSIDAKTCVVRERTVDAPVTTMIRQQ
jgi:hypothetical protein